MRSHASPSVVQREGGGTRTAQAQQIAEAGVRAARSPLPHADRIARAFGANHSIAGIRALVGGPAASASRALGSTGGYATGERIAFARPPSLRVAAHEAAHIIQQRSGLALAGGVGRAGDVHERHADAVADRVVRGQPAGDLLARYAAPLAKGPTAAARMAAAPAPGPAAAPVQMWKALSNAPYLSGIGQWDSKSAGNKVTSMVAEDLTLAGGAIAVGAGANAPTASPKSWGRLRGWKMTHPGNKPGYVRMHMLSDRLGGPGNTKENLAPGTNAMNQLHFNRAEKKLINIIDAGGHVHRYTVKATYRAGSANLKTKLGKSTWKDTLDRLRWTANYQLPGGPKKNTLGVIRERGNLDTKANWTAH